MERHNGRVFVRFVGNWRQEDGGGAGYCKHSDGINIVAGAHSLNTEDTF